MVWRGCHAGRHDSGTSVLQLAGVAATPRGTFRAAESAEIPTETDSLMTDTTTADGQFFPLLIMTQLELKCGDYLQLSSLDQC